MNQSARHEFRDVIVGLSVTASLIVVLFFVFGPSPFGASATYQVDASFQRVDGLEVGSPVQAAGVTVGRVSALELNDGFRVRTSMEIDSSVELDTDASAAIVTDGIFGGKLINIDIGGGENMIQDGGSISFTEDAVILDDLFALIIAQARANRDAKRDGSEQ